MTDSDKQKKVALCGRAFSPGAPIDRLTLFAGRLPEIRKITDAINGRGRHAIMYGEPGVGKTSLARVLKDLLQPVEGLRIVVENCADSDDFKNVWRKSFAQITHIREPNPSRDERADSIEGALADELDLLASIGPGEIRRILQSASSTHCELVIVFDEFNRLPSETRLLFANTIKDLSDNSVHATLVLVGVAKDVVELISEHASIDRCLTQILMPPMDKSELMDILNRAMKALGMTIDSTAANLILALSQGLPHYTHLLGQEASVKAITEGVLRISKRHISDAIREALQKSQQTMQHDYMKASHCQRKGTLHPAVLLACALAKLDEWGYFSSADVKGPLHGITGKDYAIPNYSPHLAEFASDSRGPVLEKWGQVRKFKYRFVNPLLRPFIIMKGLADKMITGGLLESLMEREKPVEVKVQPSLFDDD